MYVVRYLATRAKAAKARCGQAIHGERYSLCLPLAVPSLITDVRRRGFTSSDQGNFRHKSDGARALVPKRFRARVAVQSFFLEASFRFIAKSLFTRLPINPSNSVPHEGRDRNEGKGLAPLFQGTAGIVPDQGSGVRLGWPSRGGNDSKLY